MLISETAHTVLFYLAVGLALLGLVAFWVAPIFDDFLLHIRIVAVAFILLGGGSGYILIERSAKVVVVRGAPPSQYAERQYQVLSATIPTPGGDVTIEPDKQKSWVVNASSGPIEVVTIYYANVPLPDAPPPPLSLAPGQKHQFGQRRIPHVGPSDPPPRSVESSNIGEGRTWVTWGPR